MSMLTHSFELQQHQERLLKALEVASGLAEMQNGRETLDTALLLAAECAGDYAEALERHGADDAADRVAVLSDALYGMSYGLSLLYRRSRSVEEAGGAAERGAPPIAAA